MRKHKVTIRVLSQRTGITMKRIRQVRTEGLDNQGVIRDWLEKITGVDPESKRLHIPASPCTSCPYRRDTPPGVWHPEEYEKLRGYDDPQTSYGTFLCHHSTEAGRDAVCRGWLSVHRESIAARLAVSNGTIPDDARYEEVVEQLCQWQ